MRQQVLGMLVKCYVITFANKMGFHIKICAFLFLIIGDNYIVSEKIPNKEAYENLRSTIASVKKACGDVCNTSQKGIPGKYFNQITKNVDCAALFQNDAEIDAPSQFQEPPMRIPKWLAEDYSYGGSVPIRNTFMGRHKTHVQL